MPKSGDFIKIEAKEGPNAYGVFHSQIIGQNPRVTFLIYDAGIPYTMTIPAAFPVMPGHIPDCPNIANVVSADDFLAHLTEAREKFGKRAGSKSLEGACWASRMYSLDSVIKKMQEFGGLPLGFFPEEQVTGIYVVHALPEPSSNVRQCRVAPEDAILQGIRVEPQVPSEWVSRALTYLHPQGFGVLKTGQTAREIQNSYFFTYAIPEEAVGYVKDPLEFNFNPQEASAKPKKSAKKKAPKKKAAKKKKKG